MGCSTGLSTIGLVAIVLTMIVGFAYSLKFVGSLIRLYISVGSLLNNRVYKFQLELLDQSVDSRINRLELKIKEKE